ncbi:hypothetical protein F385_761 [Pantoea agglomerans 299R]|nr:hypothetical protein F385_761 [Pantoea agglomerans 299R]
MVPAERARLRVQHRCLRRVGEKDKARVVNGKDAEHQARLTQ